MGRVEREIIALWQSALEGQEDMIDLSLVGGGNLDLAAQLRVVYRMLGATRDAIRVLAVEIDNLAARLDPDEGS